MLVLSSCGCELLDVPARVQLIPPHSLRELAVADQPRVPPNGLELHSPAEGPAFCAGRSLRGRRSCALGRAKSRRRSPKSCALRRAFGAGSQILRPRQGRRSCVLCRVADPASSAGPSLRGRRSRVLRGELPALTNLRPERLAPTRPPPWSVEDPAPPGTARQGRCAVWAGVLAPSPHLRCGAGVQGSSEVVGSLDEASQTVSARVPARRCRPDVALVRRRGSGGPCHSGSFLSAP